MSASEDKNADDFFPSEDRNAKSGFVQEFMRKLSVAGLGALFMTEEGIRSLAGQLKLPKDVLTFIIGQAEKTKSEVGRVVSEELRRFLHSETLRDEVHKMLSGLTIEISAQIRLVPSKDGKRDTEPRVVITDLQATTAHGKKKGKRS